MKDFDLISYLVVYWLFYILGVVFIHSIIGDNEPVYFIWCAVCAVISFRVSKKLNKW